jgi:multiple antibiotic resistance protein
MEHLLELFTVFVIQLFIVVDPVAGIPVFLAITPNKSGGERRSLALRGCSIGCVIIIFFLAGGHQVLTYFGIQTPAVQICGGILLFVISLDLLYGRATGTETSSRETMLAEAKQDISVTPLAIPILAGPGAIATSIIFAGRTRGPLDFGVLIAGCITVFAATYVCLHWADHLNRIIGDLGMTILTRIMGLLIAFISVQYVIDGIRTLMSCGFPSS